MPAKPVCPAITLPLAVFASVPGVASSPIVVPGRVLDGDADAGVVKTAEAAAGVEADRVAGDHVSAAREGQHTPSA